jgi:Na+/proline symporter
VSRRIRSEDDYLVAGRSLGYGLAIFTIFATWFGAETVVGAAGAIYEHGLSGGSADPFGYGICILVMGAVFAVPLWRRKLTTFADLFRQRFSVGVERLAVLLMVPTSLLWAAAQVRAFGQVLSASSSLDVDLTITIAAAVVIVYTVAGGLLADVWTDLIQGIALIVGLVVLAVAMLVDGGGEALRHVDPGQLALFGGGEVPLYEVVESWAIPIFGSVVAAELVARVIAARSPTVARNACLLGGGLYLVVGLIPVGLGLVGARLIPGLEHGEQILPLLALDYLHPVMFAVFAGALLSAILSTVDSALLVSGSLVSHNLVVPLRGDVSEAGKVRLARFFVFVFGLIAYAIALQAEGIYDLVQQASAFGSAGIFVITAWGLFSRFGGPLAATGSLLAGAGIWIVGSYVMGWPVAYLAALTGAVVAYGAGGLWESRSPPAASTPGGREARLPQSQVST